MMAAIIRADNKEDKRNGRMIPLVLLLPLIMLALVYHLQPSSSATAEDEKRNSARRPPLPPGPPSSQYQSTSSEVDHYFNNNDNNNNYYDTQDGTTESAAQRRSGDASWSPSPESKNDSQPRSAATPETTTTRSSGSKYSAPPIDYPFKLQQTTDEMTADGDDDGNAQRRRRRRRSRRRSEEEDLPQFASARKDIIAKTMSTTMGRVRLRTSTAIVGASIGAFLGKSMFGSGSVLYTSSFVAVFMAWATYVRASAYGEWTKALGMALLMIVGRTRRVRKSYPTWRHVKSSVGISSRRPFPIDLVNEDTNPRGSPWQYDGPDRDFRMLHVLIAMALVGSTCGGNLPIIPTWMGALGGAALLSWTTTLPSARGDLARTMGSRVVGLAREALDINGELELVRKTGIVAGNVLDFLMILDRQHRIKDRVGAVISGLYDRAIGVVQQQQQLGRGDGEDDDDDDRRRGGPSRRSSMERPRGRGADAPRDSDWRDGPSRPRRDQPDGESPFRGRFRGERTDPAEISDDDDALIRERDETTSTSSPEKRGFFRRRQRSSTCSISLRHEPWYAEQI